MKRALEGYHHYGLTRCVRSRRRQLERLFWSGVMVGFLALLLGGLGAGVVWISSRRGDPAQVPVPNILSKPDR